MIILALGSNIGDRLGYLTAAVRLLSGLLQDMTLSRIFESKAVLLPDATADMDMPFLNMAVKGRCTLPAELLLEKLKAFEQELGRVARGNWGPREIDIDILAMDHLVLETPKLCIPHKEMLNRDFAMVPMRDVAPDWKYPLSGPYHGKTVAEICVDKGYDVNETLRDSGLHIHV